MDPLPISINRHQLNLMHTAVDRVIADLQNKHETGVLSSGQDSQDTQREQNIANYGTDRYDEALARAQSIAEQIKSQINAWNTDAEKPHPVPLALDSFQLKMLRSGIQQELNSSQNEEQQQSSQKRQLFEDIIEQLPENSPQEDAD